jgi:hypothetical protein
MIVSHAKLAFVLGKVEIKNGGNNFELSPHICPKK